MTFDELMHKNEATLEQYYFCLIQLCLIRLAAMGPERKLPFHLYTDKWRNT